MTISDGFNLWLGKMLAEVAIGLAIGVALILIVLFVAWRQARESRLSDLRYARTLIAAGESDASIMGQMRFRLSDGDIARLRAEHAKDKTETACRP